MTVLVTGAAGHVGGNLVRDLLARGDSVRCLVHDDARAITALDLEVVNGDVLDPESLRRAVTGVEVVYHLAAVISVQGPIGGRVHAVNVEGARNIARACMDAGVRRLVYCSSIHAFDQNVLDRPIDEEHPRALGPEHPAYDRSKATAEQIVRGLVQEGLDAVILHPTAVLGPHDYRLSRMGSVLLDLGRRRLPSLVTGGFDWVDVRDVCAGLMAAEQRGRTGESYILGGAYSTVVELARLAAQITGVPSPRVVSPMWLARLGAPFVLAFNRVRGGEPLYTSESLRALRSNPRVDTSKAARELGWAPRPLAETLHAVYTWFAEQGLLQLDAPLTDPRALTAAGGPGPEG